MMKVFQVVMIVLIVCVLGCASTREVIEKPKVSSAQLDSLAALAISIARENEKELTGGSCEAHLQKFKAKLLKAEGEKLLPQGWKVVDVGLSFLSESGRSVVYCRSEDVWKTRASFKGVWFQIRHQDDDVRSLSFFRDFPSSNT